MYFYNNNGFNIEFNESNENIQILIYDIWPMNSFIVKTNSDYLSKISVLKKCQKKKKFIIIHTL